MTFWQLTIHTLLFGLLFWFGLYLITRDAKQIVTWTMEGALILMATAVALSVLNQYAYTGQLALQLLRAEQLMIVLAAFLALLTLILLAPGYDVWAKRIQAQKNQMILAWVGFIALAFSVTFLIFSGGLTPTTGQLLALGISMMVLATAVSMILASDLGEAWLPHIFRSFDYSFFTAVLFGGQVALIMAFAVGVTFPMLLLLLGTVAAAILVQVFSTPVQTAVDQIAFFRFPSIRQKRSELRAESEAAQRVDSSLNVLQMSEETFTKHTRRALSQMGNLPKLAANPLTNLPLVRSRIGENGRSESTLVRATELKIILMESIEHLKPPGEETFGTTDAWRHYNALYFPYVQGLRPYSRRYFYEANGDGDKTTKEAPDWFRSQVPERTLYNWQNAAAELVARDLRERSRVAV